MKRLNRWARRSALVCSVLGVGVLAAGNVAAGGGGAVAAAAGRRAAPAAGTKSPIKVAWLATLTGADAADGMAQVKGFKLGLKVFGDTVDGHRIEASYLNSESTPTIALSAAKRAVETYHASVILGPLLGNLLAAVAPYVLSRDVPQLTYATSGYTQIKADVQSKAGFVTGYTPTQVATEGAKWAYDTMHWHHITTLADDYNYGWESVGGFDKEFAKLGGTITKTIWVPVTRADVSTYVSEIPSTTQAVFTELLGPQGTDFYSQMKAYGFTTKVGVLGMASTIDRARHPEDTDLCREAVGLHLRIEVGPLGSQKLGEDRLGRRRDLRDVRRDIGPCHRDPDRLCDRAAQLRELLVEPADALPAVVVVVGQRRDVVPVHGVVGPLGPLGGDLRGGVAGDEPGLGLHVRLDLCVAGRGVGQLRHIARQHVGSNGRKKIAQQRSQDDAGMVCLDRSLGRAQGDRRCALAVQVARLDPVTVDRVAEHLQTELEPLDLGHAVGRVGTGECGEPRDLDGALRPGCWRGPPPSCCRDGSSAARRDVPGGEHAHPQHRAHERASSRPTIQPLHHSLPGRPGCQRPQRFVNAVTVRAHPSQAVSLAWCVDQFA